MPFFSAVNTSQATNSHDVGHLKSKTSRLNTLSNPFTYTCEMNERSPDLEPEIRASEGGMKRRLLIVTYSQLSGNGFEIAEEAASAMVWSRGEIEFGRG
jgi:hypothetical protein